MNIPILIICYNNHKYVDNIINQLIKINNAYTQSIIIIDNNSDNHDTIQFLQNTKIQIIHNPENNGPWIVSWCNEHIYDILPDKFILTDPDLEFDENIPANFIEIMVSLSDKYQCSKLGLALKIDDFNEMYNGVYVNNKTIYEHETEFWVNRIDDNEYELYHARVDTTFHIFNKKVAYDNDIRIAGNFTVKHIPWYLNNPFITIYDYKKTYNQDISTISWIINNYIDEKFFKIHKNNEFLLIENRDTDTNLNFWTTIYSSWENEKFDIFDRYLNKDKIFIDIGGWIGTTCIYGSRNSRHVYVVEADKTSFQDLTANCKINCDNTTLINRAIFNENDTDIVFGKNQFSTNSSLNDSTSQININAGQTPQDGEYIIKTITIQTIIDIYNINPAEISLIKVDIEGGEEYILNDLYAIMQKYNIPLHVSFHYSWWTDYNLDRFTFLTDEQKDMIQSYPFISLILQN
jgi:FkbM family methyltransferase